MFSFINKKKREKEMTDKLHKLMEYSFGEIGENEYHFLTSKEKEILTHQDFLLLKRKKFTVKL